MHQSELLRMVQRSQSKKLHYILRIAIAMCFIGHGAFGIITKEIWCNYFAVFGISKTTAYQLMPVVGIVDIVLGIIMLFYPLRAIAAWLVAWGIFTALLRPLSGEPFAEFIERAGNYGAPLVLLILSGSKGLSTKGWFSKINPSAQPATGSAELAVKCLQIIAFLLLSGHGWLNIIEKKGLLNQYSMLGFNDAGEVAQIVGFCEVIAAFVILVKPFRQLVFVLFIWKMASEIFYPHYGMFEWIERGGSYGTLLALWFSTKENDTKLVIPWLFGRHLSRSQ